MPTILDDQEYIRRYPWKAIQCAVCGTLFLKTKRGSSKQKTCSPECSGVLRVETQKKAVKEFRKKHPHYYRREYHEAVAEKRKERTSN